jgi:hypothetical protein
LAARLRQVDLVVVPVAWWEVTSTLAEEDAAVRLASIQEQLTVDRFWVRQRAYGWVRFGKVRFWVLWADGNRRLFGAADSSLDYTGVMLARGSITADQPGCRIKLTFLPGISSAIMVGGVGAWFLYSWVSTGAPAHVELLVIALVWALWMASFRRALGAFRREFRRSFVVADEQ